MIKVALYYRLGDFILNQSKTEDGRSSDGRYQFFVNQEINSPDFVVVIGKPHKQPMHFNVAPENTVLAFYEPYSVVCYPKAYREQYGLVLSCQPEISGENVRYTPPIIPWTVGVSFLRPPFKTNIGYNELLNRPTPRKTKLLSVITSNKSFTRGHYERIVFVNKLKEQFGDQLDIFGEGFNDFDDKLEVLSPYKYHIVIENSRGKYYWTEKFKDALIAETFPIYYGCTNIKDYFPETDFPEIDIADPDEAVRIVKNIIENNEYEKGKSLLHELKTRCITEMNIFDNLARVLDTLDYSAPKKTVTLKPAKTMTDLHNFINYTFTRNYWKWKGKHLKNLSL